MCCVARGGHARGQSGASSHTGTHADGTHPQPQERPCEVLVEPYKCQLFQCSLSSVKGISESDCAALVPQRREPIRAQLPCHGVGSVGEINLSHTLCNIWGEQRPILCLCTVKKQAQRDCQMRGVSRQNVVHRNHALHGVTKEGESSNSPPRHICKDVHVRRTKKPANDVCCRQLWDDCCKRPVHLELMCERLKRCSRVFVSVRRVLPSDVVKQLSLIHI